MPLGQSITRILASAIAAVEPGEAVRRFVKRKGDTLIISGRTYDLLSYHRVILLGIGKASLAMSEAMAEILGASLSKGLIILKQVIPIHNTFMEICVGDHPIPGKGSLEAGKKALELVSSLEEDDLLICLISGGGSALVTAPVPGLTLKDIQGLTSLLLACGASIDEINILRRRLDRIKGGGIVKMASGATIISLILSDVMGDQLEVIASGPTAPDPTTRFDALRILKKYGLEAQISESIPRIIKKSMETLKPGKPILNRVQNVVVGSNLLAMQAALDNAGLEGFYARSFGNELKGEARVIALQLTKYLMDSCLNETLLPRPACIVAGGETTVTVSGKGKGGRNTELALATVRNMADLRRTMIITMATDGEDGPTEAAGAVVTGNTLSRAAAMNLDPDLFLSANDSFSFFESLDDLLKPGPTGTNVNDLVFLVQY